MKIPMTVAMIATITLAASSAFAGRDLSQEMQQNQQNRAVAAQRAQMQGQSAAGPAGQAGRVGEPGTPPKQSYPKGAVGPPSAR